MNIIMIRLKQWLELMLDKFFYDLFINLGININEIIWESDEMVNFSSGMIFMSASDSKNNDALQKEEIKSSQKKSS